MELDLAIVPLKLNATGERRIDVPASGLVGCGEPLGTIEALREMGPLTTVSINDMRIDTMSSTDTPKVPGPKFTSRHPLTVRAKALGMSIPDVADELTKALKRKVPRTTVRSWYAPKGSDSARAIPADAVGFFEAEPWGIPRDAWKNGIKDTD